VLDLLKKAFPFWKFGRKTPKSRTHPPPELKTRPAPYSLTNVPDSIADAERRLEFLNRRRGDWRSRSMGKLYNQMAAHSDAEYAAIADDLRGDVRSVMRADFEERRFLQKWVSARIHEKTHPTAPPHRRPSGPQSGRHRPQRLTGPCAGDNPPRGQKRHRP
jgi:hypothetical protein